MRLPCRHAAILLAMTLSAQTKRLNTEDILRLPYQPPAARIAYGSAPAQHAELRRPDGAGPFPVIVIIHGGCWIDFAATRYTAHLASELVKEGWATWNLEYRRAHEAGGGWPGTFQDVGRGIDALRDASGKYSLDLSRVVVMGHSAGGQLALWAGGRKRIPANSELHTANPLPLKGVVSLAGIADMRTYLDRGVKDCAAGEWRVMGGTYGEHPERYAAASPIELLPMGTPQVLVWAEHDTVVPEALMENYEKRARETGDRVEVIRVKGAAHHELCSAQEAGWKQIVAEIRSLLH